MPPCDGIGIDRMAMLITGLAPIPDVTAFPLVRLGISETLREKLKKYGPIAP